MTMYGIGSRNAPIVIDDSDEEAEDDLLVAKELRPDSPGLPTPSPPPATRSDQEKGYLVPGDTISQSLSDDQTCKVIRGGKGYQLLLRMGFKPGYGLGPQLEGPTDPLEPHLRRIKPQAGLGTPAEPAASGNKVSSNQMLKKSSTQPKKAFELDPQAPTFSSLRAGNTVLHSSSLPSSSGTSSNHGLHEPISLLPSFPPLPSVPLFPPLPQLPLSSFPPLPQLPLPPLPPLPPLLPLSPFVPDVQGPFGYSGYSWVGSHGATPGAHFPPFVPNVADGSEPLSVLDQAPATYSFGYSIPPMGLQRRSASEFQDSSSASVQQAEISTSAVDPLSKAGAQVTTSAPIDSVVADNASTNRSSTIVYHPKKNRHIGMNPDPNLSSTRGTFPKISLCPPPSPATSLVMEILPRKFRNANFILEWLNQFEFNITPRFEINEGKALIEFESRAAAQQAWMSPRMGGMEGLQGVRLFWYRPVPLEPVHLVEATSGAQGSTPVLGTIEERQVDNKKNSAAASGTPSPIKVASHAVNFAHNSTTPSVQASTIPSSASTDSLHSSHVPSHPTGYAPESIPRILDMDYSSVLEPSDEDMSQIATSEAVISTSFDNQTVERQHLLARQRALEEKIALAKAEMNRMKSCVNKQPEPTQRVNEVDQHSREESLRRMVLLSKRKRVEPGEDTPDMSATSSATPGPGEQKTPVASSSTSHATASTSSPSIAESSSGSPRESTPATSRSSALDELAISFITSAIESSQPPPAKRLKSEKEELAKRQKELESHIIETKSLMQLLTTTHSKEDKTKIMTKLRALNRRMEEISKANNAVSASATTPPPRSNPSPPAFLAEQLSHLGHQARWPETPVESGILVVSDSEDGDSDMDADDS